MHINCLTLPFKENLRKSKQFPPYPSSSLLTETGYLPIHFKYFADFNSAQNKVTCNTFLTGLSELIVGAAFAIFIFASLIYQHLIESVDDSTFFCKESYHEKHPLTSTAYLSFDTNSSLLHSARWQRGVCEISFR